jgi:2-methylisocitrate lyase-like PEP mutase family enzyme
VKKSAGGRLRDLLALETPIICPGVVSPLFATLAERAGFDVVYATGAGISNTWLGMPDLGLMGMSELLAVTSRIAGAVSIPVIADIDTGYGNILNVTRTVQEFERGGVAAVQIEDQMNPKRCGHFDDKVVVSIEEMTERVLAASEARRDPDLVIIARTDSLATEGLRAAIARGHRYVDAGADMIFIEAPESEEDLRTIGHEFDVPLLVNMVEGGKTPILPMEELAAMGFKLVLYANTILRMTMSAAVRTLDALRDDGNTLSLTSEMATWQQRQTAVDLDQWLEVDSQISERAAALNAVVMKGASHAASGGH